MRETKTGTLTNKDRFDLVTVRLIKGQVNMLNECVDLSGQTRTDLIREALAMYIPSLLRELRQAKGIVK